MAKIFLRPLNVSCEQPDRSLLQRLPRLRPGGPSVKQQLMEAERTLFALHIHGERPAPAEPAARKRPTMVRSEHRGADLLVGRLDPRRRVDRIAQRRILFLLVKTEAPQDRGPGVKADADRE